MTKRFFSWLVPGVFVTLFLVPFFWFSPYEMDLGGDASRLYFLNPKAYLTNLNLYLVSPQGIGDIIVYQFSTPFILLLLFIKTLVRSSYFVVVISKSFLLAGAFLGMYLVVNEILTHTIRGKTSTHVTQVAAILAGLFYCLNPIVQYGGWNRELFDHAQVAVNPFIFYLLLKFIHTKNHIYIMIGIITTFLFSVNFSLASAPKFFAFYPIVLVFLGIYSIYVRKSKINVVPILFYILLLVLLHSFHIVPLAASFFDQGSLAYKKVFTSSAREDAISFFNSNIPHIKLQKNLLGIAPESKSILDSSYIVFPLVIFVSLLINGVGKKKYWISTYIYHGVFMIFLVTYFFASAGVFPLGRNFYSFLFYVPGFNMFRSFFGQWAHSYIFFYSVLFGLSSYLVFQLIRKEIMYLLVSLIIVIVGINALPFIRGEMANVVTTNANGKKIRSTIEFESEYEDLLHYIAKLPTDGKILTLPLTDHFYQIIAGKGMGVYLGPSTISYLTGKNDFSGYQILKPYSELFEKYVKTNDFKKLNRLLGLLNIRYIFYNSDERILHDFPDFPYQHMHQFLPADQDSYAAFIKKLAVTEIVSFGDKYHMYKLDDQYSMPNVYVSTNPIPVPFEYNEEGYISSNFIPEEINNNQSLPVFLGESTFQNNKIANQERPKITYIRINPTKYKVDIEDITGPYYLVLLSRFNDAWEVSHNTNRLAVPHIEANGYANAWYITPYDIEKNSYQLVISLSTQNYVYIGNILTMVGLTLTIGWLVFYSLPRFPAKKY